MEPEFKKKDSYITKSAPNKNHSFSKYDYKHVATCTTKSMQNYQMIEEGVDDNIYKKDRIIYYSVDQKSEVESLDCICVTQNHQIDLPHSLNSSKLLF